MRRAVVRPRIASLATTLLCVAGAGACADSLVARGPADDNLVEFESTWTWIDSLYPAFEEKAIDWEARYWDFRTRAEAAAGDGMMVILVEMLAELRDAHAYVQTAGGAVVYPYLTDRFLRDRAAFSPALLRSYFDEPLHVSRDDVFEYGMLRGGVGYLRIATFEETGMDETFRVAMASLRETDALVLDLRNNNGGKSANVAAVMSRFVDRSTVWMDAFEQDGLPFEPWPPIQPDRTAGVYSRPVVILQNGAVISAGELLAELMKQLDHVTALGDTTGGTSCNDHADRPGDLRLASGRLVHVPTACVARYDGLLIEVNGVPPDVYVPMTAQDVESGRDVQLEAALARLVAGQGLGATPR